MTGNSLLSFKGLKETNKTKDRNVFNPGKHCNMSLWFLGRSDKDFLSQMFISFMLKRINFKIFHGPYFKLMLQRSKQFGFIVKKKKKKKKIMHGNSTYGVEYIHMPMLHLSSLKMMGGGDMYSNLKLQDCLVRFFSFKEVEPA